MASIRRSDIMHKKYSKGRPAKPERERVNRRQEAYKWRDARRVYLAGSFDRWRKLRSSLKLKDSSLAWHLMEAHEKGQCINCRHSDSSHQHEENALKKKQDQKEFLPSLISSLRQLCHAHFEFDDCIGIVGLLCLEFDNKRKENFSLHELIKSGSKPALSSYVSKSHQQQHDHTSQDSGGTLSVSKTDQQHTDVTDSNVSTTLGLSEQCLSLALSQGLVSGTESQPPANPKCRSKTDGKPCGQDTSEVSSSSKSPDAQLAEETADSLSSSFLKNKQVDSDNSLSQTVHIIDTVKDIHSSCKDTNSSPFELNSPENITSLHNATDNSSNSDSLSKSESTKENHQEHIETHTEENSYPQENENLQRSHMAEIPDSDQCNKVMMDQRPSAQSPNAAPAVFGNAELECNKDSLLSSIQLVYKSEEVSSHCPAEPAVMDLPLDMSVLKPNIKKEMELSIATSSSSHSSSTDTKSHSQKDYDGSRLDSAPCAPYSIKQKVTEPSSLSSQGSRRSPFRFENKLGTKHRDEGHASIPWQRRDMSRKEEYEFLEMSPFCDLAEFSQRYPHVHQRTYYRWKRRIKEEYIILEQCPDMSFQEFSNVVLQAKESVFHHWKALIGQGKGFFAPSDTSKRMDTKWSPKPGTHANNEYNAIQKNLSITYEQFCQLYPGTAVDTFNHLKRRALQEFWLFHQNQHMSYKDFSKLVNISEEIFNAWKEYLDSLKSNPLSSNLKVNPTSVSPNPPLSFPSFQSLGSPSSAGTDRHSQSPKDSLFNVASGNHAALKESLAAVHAEALNSALSDSVARSLSTSYLASLQNMIFPWHSYYGMTTPIGQQMLPMMLWPSMMGLAGGITNPLGLASGSRTANMSGSSSMSGLHSSLLGQASERNESPTSFESHGKQQSEPEVKNKRPASDENPGSSATQMSSDGEKKMKLSSEKDDGDFWGSFSRSRKQNKQEYVYYLKNPELGFRELESLFPTISMRTFYRWRKEMNAAVLLLEENKDMTFQQFQMVFPDIPEDIFEFWKEKARKGQPSRVEKENQPVSVEEMAHINNKTVMSDSEFQEEPLALDKMKSELTDSTSCLSHDADESHSSGEDTAYQRKCSKEEYLYVQKNPDIDFTTFSKMYPNISVRSFYRWKKELKDAIDYLRANPNADFESYKLIDATASEEVFNVWKILVHQVCPSEEDDSENATPKEDRDVRVSTHVNRKLSGPEYWFLQQHPYVEFSQFTRTYPEVPKRTFYRWKQEIHQIMSYIRDKPNVEFSEIASVLPEVSLDAFQKWKDLIASETEQTQERKDIREEGHTSQEPPAVSKGPEVDEYTKSLMTNALLHLMHNPTIKYKQFKTQFEFVSAATFELWLNRIKTVILHIASDPDMDYTAFSVNVKDVDEEIFNVWKGLSHDDITVMDVSSREAQDADDEDTLNDFIHSKELYIDNSLWQNAFEFCQRNPDVSFTSFQVHYPTISEVIFHSWQSQTQGERQYLEQNPSIEFPEFSQKFPFTKQEIFEEWKTEFTRDINLSQESSEIFQADQPSAEAEVKHHAFEDSSQLRDGHSDDRNPDQTHVIDYISRRSHLSPTQDDPTRNIDHSVDDPKESTLSKLARLADLNAAAHTGKYLDETLHKTHDTDTVTEKPKTGEMASAIIEQLYKNNNNHPSPVHLNNLFHSSTNPVPSHLGHARNFGTGGELNDLQQTSPLHSSSLSALMAMSRSSEAVGKGGSASSSRKEQLGTSLSSASGNPVRHGATNGPLSFVSNATMKDEDEGFSSQRQKKMSRAEYMFVKDNPDVDSQEFSRIFPGVSARTFYRWKKEIKAQLQLT